MLSSVACVVATLAFTPSTPCSTVACSTVLRARGGAVSAVAVALPPLPVLGAAAVVPSCLGLWKTGYTVSYGYGGAMLAAGASMLWGGGGLSALSKAHSAALVFYGLRLNLFLLYRELNLPEDIHQMKRRDATLVARLKRAPVILGCSLLYYLMAAPLRVTAVAPAASAASAAAVAVSFVGFGVAAAGDVIKTIVKAKEGKDFLVTGGPFRWLRHPNYTGELLGWTASTAAALIAATSSGGTFARSVAPWLVGSLLGWVGIVFVLAGEATAGLEKKQMSKYGGTDKYEQWLKTSWSGPMIALGGGSSND